jgi:diadenosine tetraphosphatase ApaH/serine/threonine PP2A family protein phosphatase
LARWIQRLFGNRAQGQAAGARVPESPAVPEGHRIYAIGDIHGRADLLRQLHALIAEDAASAVENIQKTVVYLGDYVDRGLESKTVIDLVAADPPADMAAVRLKGNHEETMLYFLDDVTIGPAWFAMGGDATAYSYGVGLPKGLPQKARFDHAWHELHQRLPAAHLSFLTDLQLSYTAGDYMFVHAGVRPDVALDRQNAEDLLWIRDEFLSATTGWDKVIVHGHSASHRPQSLPQRIGVDTGAYATNVLTSLVLEGRERRFLST